MTREEAIKKLESLKILLPATKDEISGIIKLIETPWISVKDKLPPIQSDSLWSKRVICASKYGDRIFIDRYGGRFGSNDIGWSGNDVIYWMPLPELPKE